MNVSLLLFIFLGIFFEDLNARIQPKQLINGIGSSKRSHNSNVQKDDSRGASQEEFITQPVDHFDSNNKKTFQQRYFYNDQWFNRTALIDAQIFSVFLMLQGETAADDGPVVDDEVYFMTHQAAYLSPSLVFNLEHRNYGLSNVTNDLSTENLKYLTSRQALADVENFIQTMNEKFNLQGWRWVVFGGGYAGALAAWSMLLYPTTVWAVVASSAMVEAKVDYSEYMNTVQTVINSDPSCGIILQDAIGQIAFNLQSANGRQQLFKGFHLCEPLNPNSTEQLGYFYLRILGPYMDRVTNGKLSLICDMINNMSSFDSIGKMYAINNQVFYANVSCVDVDYGAYIRQLKNTSVGNSDRAWLYQKCDEFGFFPTTTTTTYFYAGNILPVDWYIKRCSDVFGSERFDNASVYANIDRTNSFYHGQSGYDPHNDKHVNVLTPNGMSDPWYNLSITIFTNGAIPINMDGVWHCADMRIDGKNDPMALIQGREIIYEEILGFFLLGVENNDTVHRFV